MLEIACGKGRHTAQIASRCRLIYADDASVDALAELASRNGLEIVSQRVFDWAAPGSDALTQMRKP